MLLLFLQIFFRGDFFMKKAMILLLAVSLSLCLFGCGDGGKTDETSQSSATADSATADSATEPATRIAYSDKTQRVGSDEFGYMDIPDNFKLLPQPEGKTDLQYADPSGTVVITLNKLSADISSLNAMQSIENMVKQGGATDIKKEFESKVNNMSAMRLDCYYPAEKKSVTVYLVPSLEGTNYIAAEYPKGDDTALKYIQSWRNVQKSSTKTGKIKKNTCILNKYVLRYYLR